METQELLEKPRLTELVFNSVDIDGRADTLKATYWLLLVSISFAIAGGYVGSHSETVVDFFTSTIGLIVGLVVLNVIPAIALAAVSRPGWGMAVLGLDGFLSGIVISPLLFIAPAEAIWASLAITGAIFGSVTAYIMTTRKTFSAPRALVFGIFVSITAAVLLSTRIDIGGFGILLSALIAVFGVFTLVINTSRVLRNPLAVGAVPGALMLFAGIFNVFVGVLRIALRIMGGGRRR